MIEDISFAWRIKSLRWLLAVWREQLWLHIAWKLPASLIYWATIRCGAHATTGEYSNQVVPDLYFMDALRRWESDNLPSGQARKRAAA